MARYIDADNLIHHDIKDIHGNILDVIYASDIDNEPTADVAPVRHGRWARKKALIQCDLCGFGLFPDGYFFKNGECTHSNEPSYRPNYCPHCGAKMDGEENENDR